MRLENILAPGISLLLALLAVPAVAEGPFTLEDVLSAPFPSNLVAAPSGETIAWVVDDEGVRNLWIAEAPDYQGRQLTAYADDDGQTLGQPVFTPGEEWLVFVRGGAPNGQGEIPNPLSDPEGTSRSIHVIALSGGEPRKLAEGSSPVPSPDGQRIAFLNKGQVFTVDLDPPADEEAAGLEGESEESEDEEPDTEGAKTAKPEQLFKIRGRAGQLAFSPDGRWLAFVSNRRTHSFVGLYDLTEETLRYLDASVDSDRGPVFSPDGRRIAYLRTPRESGRLPFSARRRALPWSIRIAEVESGEARELWRADTALGLARASELFAAGVDLHGVHDWRVFLRSGVEDYDHEVREAVLKLAFESSPMASVERWRSPVLLIHGDDDRNVPFSESVDLAEALRRRGVEFEQLIFPDEVHSFLVHRHWLAAYRAAVDFLDRRLKSTGHDTPR